MTGLRYCLGSREEGGALAGVGGVQLAVLLVGCAVALGFVRGFPSALGLVLAAAAVGAAAAVAFVPAGGATVAERVPTWAGWAWRTVRGAREWRSSVVGHRRDSSTGPPGLDGVELLRVPLAGGGEMGVLADRAASAVTSVLELRCASLVLDDEDQARDRLAAWAGLLAATGREASAVRRVQWLERTVPDDGSGVGAPPGATPTVSPLESPMASYLDLVGSAVPARLLHRIHLAVQVDAGAEPLACLVDETERIRRELDGRAGIEVVDVLAAASLGDLLRSTFEPACVTPGRAGVDVPPWPLAVREEWDRLRTDMAVHGVYWAQEWPSDPVGARFLAPLLLEAQAVRTVSVVFESVPVLRAQRDVRRRQTGAVADDELRRRWGFRAGPRRRQERARLDRREAELAVGHTDVRFACFVAVSGTRDEELDRGGRDVERAALGSGVVLRRLCGDQAGAFSCVLPLCRGLR